MPRLFIIPMVVSVGKEDATLEQVKEFVNDYMTIDIDIREYGTSIGLQAVDFVMDDIKEVNGKIVPITEIN